MVYRGKPSAGCENCRKAKKRCGLEQPACLRCVKLKKVCTGYRDTNALQIQDETSSVKRKAERQNAKSQLQSQSQSQFQSAPTKQANTQSSTHSSNHLAPPKVEFEGGIPTPASSHSDSTTSSDETIDIDPLLTLANTDPFEIDTFETSLGANDHVGTYSYSTALTFALQLKPKPDDIAANYFFESFTSNNHWQFMRTFAASRTLDPCLELAMKACGMAALDNVQNVPMGTEYAQSMYVEALGLLNDALRDPKRCKTDESLIAVAMLGYYENLTCDGFQSIQSWKAHVKGATQLLKIRGKNQFKTTIGRILFRETRNQIMVHSIWDDEAPPDFLWEYQSEVVKYNNENDIAGPIDAMSRIIFEFALLRANIRYKTVPDNLAASQAAELERQIIEWQVETSKSDERWRYYDMEVDDSEHVWGNMVHSYWGQPVPNAWNTIRGVRIMLTRTQEMLCRRLSFSETEHEEQMQYFRQTRRQLTDEICATTPCMLGHASPAFSSPSILISAYAAIWPLFFAGTCALERVGTSAYGILTNEALPPGQATNKAAAQAQWIIGRLEYISTHIGLKWADGVLAVLRGDFKVPPKLLEEYVRWKSIFFSRMTDDSQG